MYRYKLAESKIYWYRGNIKKSVEQTCGQKIWVKKSWKKFLKT